MKRTLVSIIICIIVVMSSESRAPAQVPPPPPYTEIQVTDSVAPVADLQIPFNEVTKDNYSDQNFTVTNKGNVSLVIGVIAQADGLEPPFSIINNACSGKTILPAKSCTFHVRFAPDGTVLFLDTFDIPSNDPYSNPVTLTVSGTGVAVPVSDISLSDSVPPAKDHEISFGNITEGNASDETITISNEGNRYLFIRDIALSDLLEGPFSIENDLCSGQTLNPQGSCALTVRFAPDIAGTFLDTFDIPSSDPDTPSVTVTVGGTGLAFVLNNQPSAPAPVYPAHGQKELGTSVQFRWEKSKDPDGDTVAYDFKLCEDIELTSSCISDVDIAAVGNIYYAGVGGYGAVFMVWGLMFMITGKKSDRKIVSPFLSVIVLAGCLIISCGGGGGGGGSDGSGAGSTVINDNDNEHEKIPSDNVVHTVSALKGSTTYYWKVTARDSKGAETESTVRSFETL